MNLLTVTEVADRLSISKSLVYAIVESGKIAAHRIGNGRGCVRISEDDLGKYLSACRSEKTGETPQKRTRPTLKHIRL